MQFDHPPPLSDESLLSRASAMLARFDGDAEVLQILGKVFLEEYPDQLSEVTRAVRSRDAARLAGSAHKIKGTLGVFGDEWACGAALELEQQGEQGDFDGVDARLGRLVGEIRTLTATIRTKGA